MQTIVGVFHTHPKLRTALHVVTQRPGFDPRQLAYFSSGAVGDEKLSAANQLAADDIVAVLTHRGVPVQEAARFSDEASRGRHLLIMTVPDDAAEATRRLFCAEHTGPRSAIVGQQATPPPVVPSAADGDSHRSSLNLPPPVPGQVDPRVAMPQRALSSGDPMVARATTLREDGLVQTTPSNSIPVPRQDAASMPSK